MRMGERGECILWECAPKGTCKAYVARSDCALTLPRAYIAYESRMTYVRAEITILNLTEQRYGGAWWWAL